MQAQAWVAKAQKNLQAAELALTANLFDACANRAYYAAYQAAIGALIWYQVPQSGKQYGHDYVMAMINQGLIRRRKILSSQYSDTLYKLMNQRHLADYQADIISQKAAARSLAQATKFIQAIEEILI